MSYPIQVLKANKGQDSLASNLRDGLFRTDSSARFVLDPSEKASETEHRPDGVLVGFVSDGKPTVIANQSEQMAWEITFTDRRVVFWSPMVMTLFSGMKPKPGQGMGCYVEYQDILMIACNETETPGLACITMLSKFALGEIVVNYFTADAAVATSYLGRLTDNIKAYWAHRTQAPVISASTIDNYVRAVVAQFPKDISRGLLFTGSIARVEDDQDRIDAELTDIKAYSDAGITFSTN